MADALETPPTEDHSLIGYATEILRVQPNRSCYADALEHSLTGYATETPFGTKA